jgi:hypothetical protein
MTRDTRRLERRSHPSRCAYTFSTCRALMQAVSPRTTVVTSASIRSSAGPVATGVSSLPGISGGAAAPRLLGRAHGMTSQRSCRQHSHRCR